MSDNTLSDWEIAYCRDWEITAAMITYGGGFVAALGALYRRADPMNQVRLKAAFPEYWQEYAELARRSGRTVVSSDEPTPR